MNINNQPQILRLKQVCAITNLSAATIWRKLKTDPTFPKPFKIGTNSTAWDFEEISEWIKSCKLARSA